MLRPYQQAAVDAALDFWKGSADPILIDAATGAGKSHIIAAVAEKIHGKTGKRVLCLAPSAELVQQNRAKYVAAGYPASTFSASAGGKDTRHPVVFGSPLTVKNKISRFQIGGDSGYALVIVDECHGITPTIRGIIDAMRLANPYLRVLGLTATPYRLGSGYIFNQHPNGKCNDETTAKAPYFEKCVYQIGARELIKQGYLTPPVIGSTSGEAYDTSGLVANARGQFDADAVDRAYHGQGRKTAAIVADIVAQSQNRQGVLLFAATVKHAEEVLASLPPQISAIVTGATPKAERARMLEHFLARKIKYLVNVSVLTTGFDAPHVDVVALLRKTESVGLLQQIIGRGLRLDDGKADCLVLDYTTNIADHCPDGDLFAPIIQAVPTGKKGSKVPALCPSCGYENQFSAHKNAFDYIDAGLVDANGYCVDLIGERVQTDFGPMPAHHGRRCWGRTRTGPVGEYERCDYRWTSKECPNCGEANDIAARYCSSCRFEIVDPNEKLVGEFRAMKKDPHRVQTDVITSIVDRPGVSQNGNRTLRVDFVTPYRSFSVWYMPDGTYSRQMRDIGIYNNATANGAEPSTVTYQKEVSGFYRVLAFNRPADQEPELPQHLRAAE